MKFILLGMGAASFNLWFTALLLSVLAGIPYLILVRRTARDKSWQRFTLLLVLPLVTFLTLIIVSQLIDRAEEKKYLRRIYDAQCRYSAPNFRLSRRAKLQRRRLFFQCL